MCSDGGCDDEQADSVVVLDGPAVARLTFGPEA